MWVISGRYAPVKNTSGWSTVVSCTCELIPLPPLLLYPCITVTLVLLHTEHLTNSDQRKATDEVNTYVCFNEGKVNPDMSDPTYPVKDTTVLICRGQYIQAISVRLWSTTSSAARTVPRYQTSTATNCVLVPNTFCGLSWPGNVCW